MRVLFSFLLFFVLIFDSAEAPMAGKTGAVQASSQTGVRPIPPELSPFKQNDEQKVAYLTFDDGPSLNTKNILDVLDRYHVKATFFVKENEKPYAMKGYREINKRGHVIALHSSSHDYSVIYRSKDGFFEDLNQLEAFLKGNFGISSRLVRFPGGSRNITTRQNATKHVVNEVIQELSKKGYVYCDWNVDSKDGFSSSISEQTIINSVLKGTRNQKQAVILLHDITDMKNTVRALPEIIEGLKEQGYIFDIIHDDSQQVQFK
ncbi:polysaccharide deacetylase [Bacillus sp. V59.32b]|nr:polysaccharide deacetylase [Bacillus sp. V59.32b]